MKLVVVESPTKANTIKKYLPKDYQVLACNGHIRDLPSKEGSVLPEQDFAMMYEVMASALPQLKKITEAATASDEVLLATDPDREGEAIAWHIFQLLRQKKQLRDRQFSRVSFHEITKSAVQSALQDPQQINLNLVDAQQARRALDYLVGFRISPILWRKLPGATSAGRVQSVALRLICERETEREAFKEQEYWTLHGLFQNTESGSFSAELISLQGEKLEKFSFTSESQVEAVKQGSEKSKYFCQNVKSRNLTKQPPEPFITSTLQQEGVNKLNLSPSRMMQVAQQLYEGINLGEEVCGLITYMRTDSKRMSGKFVTLLKEWIKASYGQDYAAETSSAPKAKVKNAQEAHECIRPTDFGLTPAKIRNQLTEQQFAVYNLIWCRTVASQMAPAIYTITTVTIASEDLNYVFSLANQEVLFTGYQKVYGEKIQQKPVQQLTLGTKLQLLEVQTKQHFTEPPARFTEASLVKMLEAKGIGRPSTYAPILELLVRRHYARLNNRCFHPEAVGRLLASFMEQFFTDYVSYDFTAELEEKLDDIANGTVKWREVLKQFWQGFCPQTEKIMALERSEVLLMLEEAMAKIIFFKRKDNRCPECHEGKLRIKPAKTAVFLGCSNYPECKHTEPLFKSSFVNQIIHENEEERTVISLRQGPFGYYLQMDCAASLVKRLSLPSNFKLELLTPELALKLLALPKQLGLHHQKQVPIMIKWGIFGGYLTCGDIKVSVSNISKLNSLSLAEAELLIDKKEKDLLKCELGDHPQGGKILLRKVGRQRYLFHDKKKLKVGATEKISLAKAIELLTAKKPSKKVSSKATKKTVKKATSKVTKGDTTRKVPKKVTKQGATQKAPAK